jgi:hypothetical protein
MKLDLDLRDTFSPRLHQLQKQFPSLVGKALRKTVARHRRALSLSMGAGQYVGPLKKILTPDINAKIFASKDPYVKGRFYRHIVRHRNAFVGIHARSHLYKTVRYQGIQGANGMAYRFGFTSKDKLGPATPNNVKNAYGAEKYALILGQGAYYDHKTGTFLTHVTKKMSQMFFGMGLRVKVGKKLDYPKRVPVEEYFNANQQRMINDFAKEFETLVAQRMASDASRISA